MPKRLIPERDHLKEYVVNLVKNATRIIPLEYVQNQETLDVVNINLHISFEYDEVSESHGELTRCVNKDSFKLMK